VISDWNPQTEVCATKLAMISLLSHTPDLYNLAVFATVFIPSSLMRTELLNPFKRTSYNNARKI